MMKEAQTFWKDISTSIIDPNGRFIMYAVNLLQSCYYLFSIRPQTLISTGSGIAVPLLLLCYIFRVKIVYIESGARINELSQTGKLAYKLANCFIVKSDVLHKKYQNSKLVKLL